MEREKRLWVTLYDHSRACIGCKKPLVLFLRMGVVEEELVHHKNDCPLIKYFGDRLNN